MAENPWPELENRPEPLAAWDVLNDECRLYPTSQEMITNLTILQRLQGEYPLLTYYHRLGKFMFLDEYDEEAEGVPPLVEQNRTRFNEEFVGGAVMGIHTFMTMNNVDADRANLTYVVLNHNLLDRGNEEGLTLEDVEYLRKSTDAFRSFHQELWENMFMKTPLATKEQLASMTRLLYAERDDNDKSRRDFVKGYLFSQLSILRIVNGVNAS